MADKDRPSSWVLYKDEFCASCTGACCTMPVEVVFSDLVRLGVASPDELSPKKVAKRLAKEKIVRSYRSSSGLFMLQQQANGACVFLGKDRRCTVYEKRPSTCRDFPTKVGPRVSYCPYTKSSK